MICAWICYTSKRCCACVGARAIALLSWKELKGDVKFKEKVTHGLKLNIRNYVNSHASSQKSENLLLIDELVLFKAYKVLDVKVQKSYVSWHWRVM